ncbi:MAG TPA: lysozyme inhibitor LprI family protein [Pseudomonas sp.]|nr:lysozyme inhibitor LprI family protein [Pseudomonas sp.]
MQPAPLMLVSAALLLATPVVWAADCSEAANQASLNQCIAENHAAQDKRLNQVYGEYRARLSASQKQQLKAAQRAWMEFRDRSCAFEVSAAQGGSAYPMALKGCLAAKTAIRVEELQRLASCTEGDLACPAPAR